MLRKALLAIAAASVMTLGVGGAAAPAEAGHRFYVGMPGFFYIGSRHHRHHHFHHHHHFQPIFHGCRWHTVKVYSKKHKKKIRVRERICW